MYVNFCSKCKRLRRKTGKPFKQSKNQCAKFHHSCLIPSKEQIYMVHKNNEKGEVISLLSFGLLHGN